MEDKIVKMEFTEEDAKLLAYLAPHKEKLKILIQSNFFETKDGNIRYNFNHEGTILLFERTIRENCPKKNCG